MKNNENHYNPHMDIIAPLVDQMYEVAHIVYIHHTHSRVSLMLEKVDIAIYNYYNVLADEIDKDSKGRHFYQTE